MTSNLDDIMEPPVAVLDKEGENHGSFKDGLLTRIFNEDNLPEMHKTALQRNADVLGRPEHVFAYFIYLCDHGNYNHDDMKIDGNVHTLIISPYTFILSDNGYRMIQVIDSEQPARIQISAGYTNQTDPTKVDEKVNYVENLTMNPQYLNKLLTPQEFRKLSDIQERLTAGTSLTFEDQFAILSIYQKIDLLCQKKPHQPSGKK